MEEEDSGEKNIDDKENEGDSSGLFPLNPDNNPPISNISVNATDDKYRYTRISGPYGPLKIIAPAKSLLASLTRIFASLISISL